MKPTQGFPAITLALALLTIAASSVAQTPAPQSPPPPGPDHDAAAALPQENLKDAPDNPGPPANFAQMAAQSGMAEIALSKLALSKSSDASVKSFADTMVREHTKANDELQRIASRSKLVMPTSIDAEHADILKTLGAKAGKDFDVAYSRQMIMDHDKAITLFQSETEDKDSALATFARSTLPTLQDHRHMASQLPTS